MSKTILTPKPTRARLWAALREHKGRVLSIGLLADKAGVHVDAARHHMQGLVKGGFVAETKGERKGATQPYGYQLIKDVGVDAPMVKQDGSLHEVGVKNANMWRTMRMLRRFTFRDVAAHASTSEHDIAAETARKYVLTLHHAGYLNEVSGVKRLGKTVQPTVFMLSNDTGPKPPMIQKLKTVYDQNLNKVMWMEEAGNE